MKTWISAGVALAIAGVALAAADAQTGPQAGGGQMRGGGGLLRGACRADVEQLCSGIEPGGGRIAQCLREHQDRVSNGCKEAISAARTNRRERQGGAPDAPAPPGAPAPGR